MKYRKMSIILIFILGSIFSACNEKTIEEADTNPPVVEDPSENEKPENVNAPVDDPQNDVDELNTDSSVPEFFPWNCDDFTIDEGSGIGLFYEWVSKTEEQNEEYFDNVKHSVYVNDVPIKPMMDGLNGIEPDGEGYYKQLYWIDIGSFPAGTYEMRNVIEILEPVYDGWEWYGPDSEHEMLESGCIFTVVEGSSDEESESSSKTEPPTQIDCPLTSSIREDWETVVCETFDDNSILWLGNQGGVTTRLDNGEYIIDNTTAEAQGYKTGFTFPVSAGSAPNHMISVDGKLESNFRNCTWGIYVRSTQSEIVYFFMINNEGRYMLTGSTENDAARYLGNIDSGPHNAIEWDGVNNITAVADGKQLEFYINNDLAITHEAINSSNQQFGLIVWGGEGVTALTRLDNLLIRVN